LTIFFCIVSIKAFHKLVNVRFERFPCCEAVELVNCETAAAYTDLAAILNVEADEIVVIVPDVVRCLLVYESRAESKRDLVAATVDALLVTEYLSSLDSVFD
jgi:hypothetical protein